MKDLVLGIGALVMTFFSANILFYVGQKGYNLLLRKAGITPVAKYNGFVNASAKFVATSFMMPAIGIPVLCILGFAFYYVFRGSFWILTSLMQPLTTGAASQMLYGILFH